MKEKKKTQQAPEIEDIQETRFQLDDWDIVFSEDGLIYAEVSDGDEDEPIIMIEDEQEQLRFSIDNQLLSEIGLSEEMYLRMKEIVNNETDEKLL